MPKKRSALQTKIEYYAVRALIGAIGSFPLKTSMKIGKGTGKFIGSLIPKLKKTGRRNLEIALPQLPESEKEKILYAFCKTLIRANLQQRMLIADIGNR